MTTYLKKHSIMSYIIILVFEDYHFISISFVLLLGQAYVNFHDLSFTERTVTFSCLCAECDGIEWRRDNVPLPSSLYGVFSLKKELWPNYAINLKHSKFTTSYYDTNHYSCRPVRLQDSIFQNSSSYIDNPGKKRCMFLHIKNFLVILI